MSYSLQFVSIPSSIASNLRDFVLAVSEESHPVSHHQIAFAIEFYGQWDSWQHWMPNRCRRTTTQQRKKGHLEDNPSTETHRQRINWKLSAIIVDKRCRTKNWHTWWWISLVQYRCLVVLCNRPRSGRLGATRTSRNSNSFAVRSWSWTRPYA